jgi:folate-dependent phosphoribosylglycinamide formyltransferase PurN
VPVLPGDSVDSLAARVFEAECRTYPEAIARHAERLERAGSGRG